MEIILAGTPNTGKTTLFNRLTGLSEKTGNFAGITVEKKTGLLRGKKDVKIIDLPGTYSISGYSMEEKLAVNELVKGKDKKLIVLLDGTAILKSVLFLSELIKLNIPIIVAVNFIDELEKSKIKIDFNSLSKNTGIKFIGISARTGKNLDYLINETLLNNNTINPIDYQPLLELIKSSIKTERTKQQKLSKKLDNFLVSGVSSIVFLVLFLTLAFYLSSKIGGFLSDKLSLFFSNILKTVGYVLSQNNINAVFSSFLTNGLLSGIFSVLSFIPEVLLTFLFLSIFEQTGYLSRIAFILHKPFSISALSGKIIVPMISACGCGVNGIIATRIIEDDCMRCRSATLVTNMPCGAKVAVIEFLCRKLFYHSAIISAFIYLICFLSVPIFSFIYNKLELFGKTTCSLIMEVPTLRAPNLKDIFSVLLKKLKDFVFKAGTIIALISILLWFLTNFTFLLKYTSNGGMLKQVGALISPLFYPLGVFSSMASASLIASFFAKEAVLTGFIITNECFITPFSAFSFIVFICLSPPCISAIIELKNELKSVKKTIKAVFVQFVFSYTVSLIISLTGILVYYLKIVFIFLLLILLTIFILYKKQHKIKLKEKIFLKRNKL